MESFSEVTEVLGFPFNAHSTKQNIKDICTYITDTEEHRALLTDEQIDTLSHGTFDACKKVIKAWDQAYLQMLAQLAIKCESIYLLGEKQRRAIVHRYRGNPTRKQLDALRGALNALLIIEQRRLRTAEPQVAVA